MKIKPLVPKPRGSALLDQAFRHEVPSSSASWNAYAVTRALRSAFGKVATGVLSETPAKADKEADLLVSAARMRTAEEREINRRLTPQPESRS